MFDAQGHVPLSPRDLYERAVASPVRLINDVRSAGTRAAFPTYESYCDFLHAVTERLGVHPKNMFLRGSARVGYSIAPRIDKLWKAMSDTSDLDLCIVDAPYFHQLDDEVQRWEATNRADRFESAEFHDYVGRQRDRAFDCCRDYLIPRVICVHHHDTMDQVPVAQFCGRNRSLSAFVFRNWWSVRRRYESDLGQLVKGVRTGRLPEPPDEAFPR